MEALEPHPLALLLHIASRFSQGDTALISASMQGHAEAVRILLAAGAACECQGAGESAPRIPCSTVAAGIGQRVNGPDRRVVSEGTT